MSFTLSRASTPLFTRYLANLAALLDKAEAHTPAKNVSPYAGLAMSTLSINAAENSARASSTALVSTSQMAILAPRLLNARDNATDSTGACRNDDPLFAKIDW